ncbi:DUF4365 domain-containing protein [Streptomyces albogriseolus]|uniref:DUF4365 domain-containing protein n=1 Tax=Streptomyces albogriseolus TaxID=1887 RepID=UPI0035D6D9D3
MSEEHRLDEPLHGLPITAIMESISKNRLGLVAAGAGFHLRHPELDYDAIDAVISSSEEYELYYGPSLEVQLKCTASPHVARLVRRGTISFSLERRAYDKLSKPNRFTPALLAVLLLPQVADPSEWVLQSENGLLSPGTLLWSDPRRWPPLPDGQRSGTVSLRPSDVLAPAALQGIMKSVGDGGDW